MFQMSRIDYISVSEPCSVKLNKLLQTQTLNLKECQVQKFRKGHFMALKIYWASSIVASSLKESFGIFHHRENY